MRKNQTLLMALALLALALFLCLGRYGPGARAHEQVCRSRDGHSTGSSSPDGWRKRDVRQRLVHFFHRCYVSHNGHDSHAPLLRPSCRGQSPRPAVTMDYTSAIATVAGTAENDDNDGNGTVVVSGIPAAYHNPGHPKRAVGCQVAHPDPSL